jgi:hypothetical protein
MSVRKFVELVESDVIRCGDRSWLGGEWNFAFRTYRVVGIYDDLEQEGQIIRKEQDGIKIMVELGQRDKVGAIRAIDDILAELKR